MKRYEWQRMCNERMNFSSASADMKFTMMAQCLYDISETLALIYDKLTEAHNSEGSGDDLPI